MAIIFVPGIKGSKLVDTYPTDFDVRWSLEDMTVGDIFEDPLDFELEEGLYDRSDLHMFREWELVNFAYRRMIRRLRSWVDPRLYLFPYDWRKPLERTARRLNELVDHVRGKLRRDEQSPTVHFVTHSMGGLVLRSALRLRGRDPFAGIGRIVFVAPPFRGSCDIPRALIAGERGGWLGEDEDFRKLARSFPSVYQMVPSLRAAAVDEDGRPLDLFDVHHWQANVTGGDESQPPFLRNAEAFVRAAGAQHGGTSDAPMLSERALRRHGEDILVLLSVGHQTVRTIPVLTRNAPNPNWFDFEHQIRDREGDGRVHLESAAIRGITLAAYSGANGHGTVCRDGLIINSVSMWLEGRRLVKMRPRSPRNSVARPSHTYFDPWDGDPASFERHVV